MDHQIYQYLTHTNELDASQGEFYCLSYEDSTEIGPQVDLGEIQLSNTLSSAGSPRDPLWSPRVAFASLCGFEPATPQATIHLSQLVVPPGNHHQYECTKDLAPSRLSSLFSDPRVAVDTPPVPPGGEQSPSPGPSHQRAHRRENQSIADELSPTHSRSDEDYNGSPPTEPVTPQRVFHVLPARQVAAQSEPGVDRNIKGHPVLQYPNGSYRCLSLVTASGKASQFTRKSECPPDVGKPCGQTFRGQDEITRHLKTSSWHKKLEEERMPFECGTCGKRLSRRDALTRHIRSLHTKKQVPKSTAGHGKRRSSNKKSV